MKKLKINMILMLCLVSVFTIFQGNNCFLWASDTFYNIGGQMIWDSDTELLWQKGDDGVTREWGDSVQYCNDLVSGGFDDWRLPDVDELLTLVEPGPRANVNFQIQSSGSYWSNTINTEDPAGAFDVDFYHGPTRFSPKISLYYTICVRNSPAATTLVFTKDQLDQAIAAAVNACKTNPVACGINSECYTKEDLIIAVQKVLNWGDIDGDGKIGLIEAINALMEASDAIPK